MYRFTDSDFTQSFASKVLGFITLNSLTFSKLNLEIINLEEYSYFFLYFHLVLQTKYFLFIIY